MAAITIRDAARKFFPPWMLDRVRAGLVNGWKYIYSFLVMADLLLQFAIEGVMMKWPGFCPPAALPLIGRDRRIRRGLAETDGSYATRLVGWIDSWKQAAGAKIILTQLRAYLGTPHGAIRCVSATGTWYTMNPDGSMDRHVTAPVSNWDWDGNAALWARFWVILYASDYSWSRDGTWGDGAVWGDDGAGWGLSNVPWQEGRDLRGIISEWKSAESVCKALIISFDNALFDPVSLPGPPNPDGSWGNYYKIMGGVAVPARSRSALYSTEIV